MKNTLEQNNEIGEFIVQFLRSFGCDPKQCVARIEARLGDELAHILAAPRELRISLDPTDEGAEYVTYGHPLLDRMLAYVGEKGVAAGFLFTPAIRPDLVAYAMSDALFSAVPPPSTGATAGAQGLYRAARRLLSDETRVRKLGGRVVHQPQVLFRFKVSFVSDERRERIVSLLVDPVSERIDRPVSLADAVSYTAYGEGGDEERRAYTVERLYRRACEHLRERMVPEAASFEGEAESRLARELRRIEEYYDGLARERLDPVRSVFRRISAAGVSADLARTWHTEARYHRQIERLREEADEIERLYQEEMLVLRREKARRTAEVREQYKAYGEAVLIQAAYVMAPRFEWQVRLSARAASRKTTLLYDVLRHRFVDLVCECCERELIGPVGLCDCEAIVCESCCRECPACRKTVCLECSPGRCHVCDGLICRSCDASCPLGDHPAFGDGLRVCTACRGSSCRDCRAIATLYLTDAIQLGEQVQTAAIAK